MGFLKFCMDKKLLAFLGGIATATLGVKLLKSAPVRKAAVCTLAGGMRLRDEAVSALETLKEDAQDLYHEARRQSGEDQDGE